MFSVCGRRSVNKYKASFEILFPHMLLALINAVNLINELKTSLTTQSQNIKNNVHGIYIFQLKDKIKWWKIINKYNKITVALSDIGTVK